MLYWFRAIKLFECQKKKNTFGIQNTQLGNSHDFVSCIEYAWLFVSAQFFAVLCILHSKCIFFYIKQFYSTKPTLLLKTYTHFFSFAQFDSWYQILKTYEKNVYKRIGCLHENYQEQAYAVV